MPKTLVIDVPHRIGFSLAIPNALVKVRAVEESCVYKVPEYPTIRKTCGVEISFARRRGESEGKLDYLTTSSETSMPKCVKGLCSSWHRASSGRYIHVVRGSSRCKPSIIEATTLD